MIKLEDQEARQSTYCVRSLLEEREKYKREKILNGRVISEFLRLFTFFKIFFFEIEEKNFFLVKLKLI